jgi:pyruvate dehydrogenase phosphatase
LTGIPLSDDFNCSNPSERERLTREHPDEPDLFENNRIKGTLDPTRGFGDFKHKLNSPELIEAMTTEDSRWTPPYITAEPEVIFLPFALSLFSKSLISCQVTIHKLTRKDKYLILASDGLWEKFTNSDVVDIVSEALLEEKSIPTRLIEKFVSKTTGGLEEDKLQVLFSMAPRARRALHDDVTIVVAGIDSERLPQSEEYVSWVLSNFKLDAVPPQSPLAKSKLVDIAQLLSQIPHDSASESSDH